ncbi:ABC transporter ATP-binding protein [Desemzia sp. RIT804]|uniref:ABC transporter ATP-binding protein n=1 Tax=Desemzia sp. RIT 804 TaxID=2810209 RepID=UPI00194E44DD|nr:ABC transporter ATP-binding protein [Desemzia sp. RIT 804]MBM6615206.1 ABC transporter ATP-binding protein [Desemzia sp. RIT 804]
MELKQNGIKTFIHLLWSTKISKGVLVVGLIGSMVTTLVGLAIPLLAGNIVDEFTLETFQVSIIAAIVAAFLLQAVIDGGSAYLLAKAGQQMVARLRERLWLKMVRLPVSYFDTTPSGDSVSRVVNDTGIVRDLITYYFPQFVAGIISIIGAVTILLFMDWKMTLVMLISVPVVLLVMIPLGKKMGKISRELQAETAQFSGDIQQTFSEIRLMKSSTAEATEEEKGKAGIHRLFKTGLKESKVTSIIGPLMYLIIMAVVVLIFAYGGIRVANGTLSTGSLVAFLLYLFQIIYPVTSFATFFTQLNKTMGATERIVAILEMPDEIGQEGIVESIADKTLTFQRVSFSYQKDESVLKDVSLTAQPGEMIAFSGPSGGGKTTIFSLLERYYEPDSGEIRIGDIPIHQFSLAAWRNQIGYVSQESAMMAGTIRENLTYGLENAESILDDRLWEVAKLAYADQFIKKFKLGLDTSVGERGVMLSGGQRQRINIARAFLRDPKILLMDEATASLDSQSEQVVQHALSRLMEGRTTFVIAHRLATIVNADKIIFIEHGEITGSGTHEELKASHSLYREFAEQQLS